MSDVDDPSTSFVGDLTIQWPGGEPIQLPLDISGDGNDTVLVLEQMLIPLEGGELQLVASGRVNTVQRRPNSSTYRSFSRPGIVAV